MLRTSALDATYSPPLITGNSGDAVWFYYRFGVSFRDVEEAMASRGVLVSYETFRCWCDKFGHLFAAGLRKRRARTGDKWHLDEVFLRIDDERAL